MARPFLADPDFVRKAARRAAPTRSTPASPATRPASTTPSRASVATCLVNPRACHETELVLAPARAAQARRRRRRRARRASRARSRAAERGHEVTLFEAAREIGGQFNVAKRIPGKEEFDETLRYFRARLERTGVDAAPRRARAERRRPAAGLRRGRARHRRRAAHARDPRRRPSEGAELPRRRSRGKRASARRVAIVGAGGIGFDVGGVPRARRRRLADADSTRGCDEWGVDPTYAAPRAASRRRRAEPPPRAGLPAAAQAPASRARASARPPAGSTARC